LLTPEAMWDFDPVTGEAEWNDPIVFERMIPASQTSVFDTANFTSLDDYYATMRFHRSQSQSDVSNLFPSCSISDYIARDSYTCGPAFFDVVYRSTMVPNTTGCLQQSTVNIVPAVKQFLRGNHSQGVITVSQPIAPHHLDTARQSETCSMNLRLRLWRSVDDVDTAYQNNTLFEYTTSPREMCTSCGAANWQFEDSSLWIDREGWELDRRFPDHGWTFDNAMGNGGRWTSTALIISDDLLYQTENGGEVYDGVLRTRRADVAPAIRARLGALSDSDRNQVDIDNLRGSAPGASPSMNYVWAINIFYEVLNRLPHYTSQMLTPIRVAEPTFTKPPVLDQAIWDMSSPTQAGLVGGHQEHMCWDECHPHLYPDRSFDSSECL